MPALASPSLLAIGNLGIQEILVILIVVAGSGLWIWSLVHCCKNGNLSDKERLRGILLIVFLGVLGSAIYFFLASGKKPGGESQTEIEESSNEP